MLISIEYILTSYDITKIAIPTYMFVDKFKAIMNSKIIQACSGLSKRTLRAVVKEFINNTYLVYLPKPIIGMILYNRIVVIKELSSALSDYESENTIIGFTLMAMLYELGHFLQRFNFTSYAWFENRFSINHDKSEAGSLFINKIFNHEPTTINIEATKFMLDLSNWDLPHEKFISQFSKNNTFSKIRELLQSPLQRRLRQIEWEPGTMSLRGCCRWTRRHFDIIKSIINRNRNLE